jgi:DNA-binding NarL/FixJ family response regulator
MQHEHHFIYLSQENEPVTGRFTQLSEELGISLHLHKVVDDFFFDVCSDCSSAEFIFIDADLLRRPPHGLDARHIIDATYTLLKSHGSDAKIIAVVRSGTDPDFIKEVMNYANIASVFCIPEQSDEVALAKQFISDIITGKLRAHKSVLDIIRTKKKQTKEADISLTRRQQEILHIVQSRGATNKTIAKMLGLSESTVKLHMGAILKKFGVKNRTQLAVFTKDH